MAEVGGGEKEYKRRKQRLCTREETEDEAVAEVGGGEGK